MSRFRKDRVGELIREVISDLLARKLKDPRLQGVTITEVNMASDLKSAMVYFGCLSSADQDVRKVALDAASGFIRRAVGQELDLKYVPRLTFHYDTSFDHFAKIDKILKDLGCDESASLEDPRTLEQ